MQLQRKSIKSHNSGEISVYLCIVFTLLVSMVISAVGAAKRAAVQTLFECAVENMLCSVFGEYNRELLERYDVFFIDLSYLSNSPDLMNLESRMNMYLYDNLHPEEGTALLSYSDITDITGCNVYLTGYEFATDNLGKPFINAATDYMKNLVGVSDVANIKDLISVFDSYEISEERFNEIKAETISGIERVETETWEQTEVKESLKALLIPSVEFAVLMGNKMFSVSTEQINVLDTVSFRLKKTGTGTDNDTEYDLLDGIYFNEYILSKFGTFISPKEDTKLKYEAEYILNGLGNDYYNLLQTEKTMFGLRVAEDMIALNLADDKMEAIRAVTEPIAAALELPEIVLTQAVAFLWAFAEAITDVWELLDGEKVPFIKKSEQFNVSMEGIIPFATEMIEKQIEIGDEIPKEETDVETEIPNIELSYTDYLRIMLYSRPQALKVYKVMDLIEINLRNCGTGENAFFRFDCCVDKIKVKVSCETGDGLSFVTEKTYSYI